jgi:hypothetical protein
MQHGPLQELPPRSQREWTMLVQGINLHDPKADELLREFRFVPDARLDDLMVSFATDGGGVGPHFDSYDVFLLQAQGRRRWRIGAQQDLSLVEGLPLKILANFEPEEEFVLEPGDMLYLPPHYAHDGVAEGECMTYSIGFRSPSFQELGEAFLQFMADAIDLPGRYADPDLQPAKNPAEIPKDMLTSITEELNKVRWDEEDVTIFMGEYLSEPKHNVFFTPGRQAAHGRPLHGTGRQARTEAVAEDADAVPRQARVHQWRILRRGPGRQDRARRAGQPARPGRRHAGASVRRRAGSALHLVLGRLARTGLIDMEILRFDTRAEFQRQLRAVLERAQASLDMFDPDFSLFALNESGTDAVLRRFLMGGGTLRLAMHDTGHGSSETVRASCACCVSRDTGSSAA